MGYEEKKVRIAIDGDEVVGDALLETDEILLRIPGEPKRRKLPLTSLRSLRSDDGVLSFGSAGSTFALSLGAKAQRWLARVTTPPSLLDKLGIRAGSRVHVSGLEDEAAFASELAARGVVRVPLDRTAAIVVLGLTKQAELKRLTAARKKLADTAALWAVWPKGKKELTEDHVRSAALACGLVDVKVARFSDVRSALKLVVPVLARARKP